MADWLMSLNGRPGSWCDQTVAGTKTWELRRGAFQAEPGDTVWLYATRPQAAVVGCVTFSRYREVETFDLAHRDDYRDRHGCTVEQVVKYADGAQFLAVFEWVADSSRRLRPGLLVDLDTLRNDYGVTPSPTWVRLVDRPDTHRRGMRGSALVRELRARLVRPAPTDLGCGHPAQGEG